MTSIKSSFFSVKKKRLVNHLECQVKIVSVSPIFRNMISPVNTNAPAPKNRERTPKVSINTPPMKGPISRVPNWQAMYPPMKPARCRAGIIVRKNRYPTVMIPAKAAPPASRNPKAVVNT